MPKPALHQSGLAALYRCPCQYEFRYIRGLIIPPGVAALVGTGTHRSVAADLGSKIVSGALLPDDAIPDIAHDGVMAAWKRGVNLTDDEREQGEDAVRGAAIDKAVALSSLHHEALAPSLLPLAVEHTWRLALEGYPYDLAGTIDVREERAVRDTKTSARSPAKGAADTSLQLTTYAVATKFTEGTLPEHVMLDYLVATKKPKVVIVSSTRSEHDVEVFLRRLEVAMRQLEAGVFPPCNPGEWWCSPKWCGYHKKCPYV